MKKTSNNSDNKFAIIVCSIILVPIITFIITSFVMTMGFVAMNNHADTDNYEEYYYYMDIDESEMLDLTQSDTTMFE